MTESNKALEPKAPEKKAIEKVSDYMRSEAVRARFAEVVGSHNAGAYISSVLLAVSNSDKLKACRIESIYVSALRAATLRLSCDQSTGQAYLVPFGNIATLIVGYKGLQDMAVRTGKYRYINTNPIYEGEVMVEDRISGFYSIEGGKKSDTIIGWLAAFEMNPERGQVRGYAKTIYMTVAEIHAHAKKYSKSYSYKESGWQTDPAAMERKTVLRLLLRRWGYLDPVDIATLESIEKEDPNIVDVNLPEWDGSIEDEPKQKASQEQLMAELGFIEPPQT